MLGRLEVWYSFFYYPSGLPPNLCKLVIGISSLYAPCEEFHWPARWLPMWSEHVVHIFCKASAAAPASFVWLWCCRRLSRNCRTGSRKSGWTSIQSDNSPTKTVDVCRTWEDNHQKKFPRESFYFSYWYRYSTFRANPAKTGGLTFVTLISFSKFHFLYLT